MANYPTSLPSSTPATHGEVVDEVVAIATQLIPAWASYTPTITATSNPTLGTASVQYGAYLQIGKTVHYTIRIAFGTSGVAVGSGNYLILLPVAANATAVTNQALIGVGSIYDSSADVTYLATVQLTNSTHAVLFLDNTSAAVAGAAKPVIPAASDNYWLSGVYEAA